MRLKTLTSLFLVISIFSCNNTPQEKVELVADEQYVMQGKIIAQTAASTLMGNLISSISKRGTLGSISYCNTIGIPILDSISKVYNAQISRKSLKVRNNSNGPDDLEEGVLSGWERLLDDGGSPGIVMKAIDSNNTRFFAPIFVQSFCLQCHGKPIIDIAQNDLRMIDSLYPNDKARNYKSGDLRGMWSINMSH